jgi:hypothetical protein
MAAGHIRLVGGFVIWVFNGFKVPLKECSRNYIRSFIIGLITILVIAFLCFYFYAKF